MYLFTPPGETGYFVRRFFAATGDKSSRPRFFRPSPSDAFSAVGIGDSEGLAPKLWVTMACVADFEGEIGGFEAELTAEGLESRELSRLTITDTIKYNYDYKD